MSERESMRFAAALAACETLLGPGRKWRISPYLQPTLGVCDDPAALACLVACQTVVIDLLRHHALPSSISILDGGSPSGIAVPAVLDALLAWETTCTLFAIPSGIDGVSVQQSPSRETDASLRTFREALTARGSELSALQVMAFASAWSQPRKASTSTPTLALLPLPWQDPTVERMLRELPEGSVVAAFAWEGCDTPSALFRWRREFLERHSAWATIGPCGQEYGANLPVACLTCVHGQRTAMHRTNNSIVTPGWSYVLLVRGGQQLQCDDIPLAVGALGQALIPNIGLRYLGTVRERVSEARHPDDGNDTPRDEIWQEHLRVCPGESGFNKVAIRRQAGMQLPRLHYGQWLQLSNLQPRTFPAAPGAVELLVRDETAFGTPTRLDPQETFLDNYTAAVRAAVDEAGYRLFGFAHMHSFQHVVLERVLCSKEVFAIAATGGGKSECYILPAMLLPGISIIVSPLKSLIQDQFEQRIRSRFGLDYVATYLNGDVPFYERQGRLRRMALGHYKIAYLTPEQLERGYVLDALRQVERSVGFRYLALDEAHCISQWGHDFRPSYLNIVERLGSYGLKPKRVALTATASPLVREDVCTELGLDRRNTSEGGDVFIDTANRPELNLVVSRLDSTEEKAHLILRTLRDQTEGSAIVFMPHTGGTPQSPRDMGSPVNAPSDENLGMVSTGATPFAHYLTHQLGEPVALYHGALDDGPEMGNDVLVSTSDSNDEGQGINRQSEQRSFMAGQKRVMVATKGFGMGVDKPDIRLVIHRSPPSNLEAYAQEAGRAGRDGKPATVMLLYSKDKPRIVTGSATTHLYQQTLSSDREIQEFFIEQRYVQHQDVVAMLAFLRSACLQIVNGALYFTADEAIAAFEGITTDSTQFDLRYSWPTFRERIPSRVYESPEHKFILDAGYQYKRKCDHIARVLKVLYNNRPIINGRPTPVALVVSETGTLLRHLRLYQPERILDSPSYFGQQLREAGVTVHELRLLLPDGDRVDITALAERLGLSLRETASMMADLRSCEGRTQATGTWVGSLLNYSRLEAPRRVPWLNPYDPTTWRGYAGAYRRAQPRGAKDLNDYFPEWVINKPIGWELVPGPGLTCPDPQRYIEGFMTLHDERKRNDENNFTYLINRYIGAGQGEHTCIRSILMGYLKTNEVVIGGKCYGCSVCVPDLTFERFSLEQRRAAVARLFPETVALADQVEAANRHPSAAGLVDQLLSAIRRENAQGRSGNAYLESWLTRLIQDDPEHRSALWVRLHGHRSGLLQLSVEELSITLDRLTRLAEPGAEIEALVELIEIYRRDGDYVSLWPSLTTCLAELAGKTKNWLAESKYWNEVLEQTDAEHRAQQYTQQIHHALVRLVTLHENNGPLAEPARATSFGLRLARTPDASSESVRKGYRAATADWEWDSVVLELESPICVDRVGLLLAWLEASRKAVTGHVVDWLADNDASWSRWLPADLSALAQLLDADLDAAPRLLLHLAQISDMETPVTVAYLLRARAAGASLSAEHLRCLAANLSRLDAARCRAVLGRKGNPAELFEQLWQASGGKEIPYSWLHCFPPSIVESVDHETFKALIEAILGGIALSAWLLSVSARLTRKSEVELLLPYLSTVVKQHPENALNLLENALEQPASQHILIETLFPAVLARSIDRARAQFLLTALMARPGIKQSGSFLSESLDNWALLNEQKSTLALLNASRIEGRVLVSMAAPWLADSSKVHRVDMLAVILSQVRRTTPNNWLTPVSLDFQALCIAGRFKEAAEILDLYDDLNIKGQPARSFYDAARRNIQERQSYHNAEWRRLLELLS